MSIKTLRKRIALVAVSALGAGLMSVVAAPVASANIAHGTASATLVDSNMLISATAGGVICVATSAAGGTPQNYAANATDTSPFETTASGKVIVAVVGSDLLLEGDAADVIAISGPLSIKALNTSGTSTAAATTSGTREITMPATDAQVTLTAVAVGTATITAGTATGATATVANTITVSIVASCATTTYSASKSSVSTTTDGAAAAIANANVDAAVTAGAGDNLYIMIDGDNAYDTNLVNQGYYATATNGALLSWSNTWGTAPAKGTASVATITDADGAAVLRVSPASEAAGGTTVVTITADGIAVATKTLTFLGEATAINIVSASTGTVGTTGNGSTGLIVFTLTDATGRSVPGDVALVSTSASARTPAITEGKDATISAAVPTTVTAAAAAFPAPGTTAGVEGFDCTSVGGTGSTTLTLTHTQAVTGASITKTVDAKCAGGVATYTVSTDKASYKIGEIATITITAKDSTGAAVSDATTVGAANIISFGGGTMVLAAAAGDLFSGGVKKYQAQATTAGTFNTVVSIAGSTTTSATASYTIAGGDVTNAEVLASIVKLIAAINKQIRALQRSLR